MNFQRDVNLGNVKSNPKDLAQLSMIQIMILHTISKHPKPLVRHSLLIELNESLEPKGKKIYSPEQVFSDSLQKKPKKLISPSSFYTSLEALEKKGLVSFNRNKKGKIKTVGKTQLTESFLNYIHQYFLMNMICDKEYNKELINVLQDELKTQEINKNNIFSVFPFDIPNEELINYLINNYENVYMIGCEKLQSQLQPKQKDKITYSKIKNGQIREPDNDFDISIIQGYNRNYNFFDLGFETMIAELIRITKPNGIICIFAHKDLTFQEFAPRSALLIKNIFSIYNHFIDNEGKLLSKSQINKVLLSADLKELKIREDQGLIIGIGKV